MLPDRSISVGCRNKHKIKLQHISPSNRHSPENLSNHLFPDWLLKRTDFKRDLEKKNYIQNFKFCKEFDYTLLDKKIIKRQLQKCEFIKNLGKARVKELLQVTQLIKFSPEDQIESGKAYLILTGSFDLNQEITIFYDNIIDSEFNANSNKIRAKSEASCLGFPIDSFKEITNYSKGQQIRVISKVLATLTIFSDLKLGQYHLLSNTVLVITYPKKSSVYSIGDPSNFFYILLEGECELSSLVTIQASNLIPSHKKTREKIKFETKFTKFKSKIDQFQVFGLSEAFYKKKRQSQVQVLSEKAKIIIINWQQCEEILKPSQLERIKEEVRLDSSKDFKRQVTENLKNFKIKYDALLAASCIKQKPSGRDIFETVPKRKKLYLQALEHSHRAELNDLNFNSKGRNISGFY
jgi:hypothetical protein